MLDYNKEYTKFVSNALYRIRCCQVAVKVANHVGYASGLLVITDTEVRSGMASNHKPIPLPRTTIAMARLILAARYPNCHHVCTYREQGITGEEGIRRDRLWLKYRYGKQKGALLAQDIEREFGLAASG